MLKDFLAYQHFSTYFSTSWNVDIFFPPQPWPPGTLRTCSELLGWFGVLLRRGWWILCSRARRGQGLTRVMTRSWRRATTCKWQQQFLEFYRFWWWQDDEDIDSGVRSPIGWRSWAWMSVKLVLYENRVMRYSFFGNFSAFNKSCFLLLCRCGDLWKVQPGKPVKTKVKWPLLFGFERRVFALRAKCWQ